MSILSKFFILGFCTIIFLSACSGIKEIEYKGMKEAKLASLNFSNGIIKLVLQYYNPNNFAVDVKETNLEIFVDDNLMGNGIFLNQTKIPACANFDFPIEVQFNPLKVLGFAANHLNKKKVKMHVLGTTKIGKGGIFIKVPVDVTEEIELRK